MNSLYSILALAVMVSAKPNYEQYEPAVQSTIISQGPWVADDAWAADANRNPKEIEAPQEAEQGILARLGSWWDWDR